MIRFKVNYNEFDFSNQLYFDMKYFNTMLENSYFTLDLDLMAKIIKAVDDYDLVDKYTIKSADNPSIKSLAQLSNDAKFLLFLAEYSARGKYVKYNGDLSEFRSIQKVTEIVSFPLLLEVDIETISNFSFLVHKYNATFEVENYRYNGKEVLIRVVDGDLLKGHFTNKDGVLCVVGWTLHSFYYDFLIYTRFTKEGLSNLVKCFENYRKKEYLLDHPKVPAREFGLLLYEKRFGDGIYEEIDEIREDLYVINHCNTPTKHSICKYPSVIAFHKKPNGDAFIETLSIVKYPDYLEACMEVLVDYSSYEDETYIIISDVGHGSIYELVNNIYLGFKISNNTVEIFPKHDICYYVSQVLTEAYENEKLFVKETKK